MKEERNSTKQSPQDEFQRASLPKRSLLESILIGAGQGLLNFAKFSGLVNTTSISDIEEGLKTGGKVHVKRSQRISDDPEIPEWHLTNEGFSCFYLRSTFNNVLKETLHMIRPGFSGGAVLNFTSGKLVTGVTNAARRTFFSPEEEQAAKLILETVRSETAGEYNEAN